MYLRRVTIGLLVCLTLLWSPAASADEGDSAYQAGYVMVASGGVIFVVGSGLLPSTSYLGYGMSATGSALVASGGLLMAHGARSQGKKVSSALGWTAVGFWGVGEVLLINGAVSNSYGLAFTGYTMMGASTILGAFQGFVTARAMDRSTATRPRSGIPRRAPMALVPWADRDHHGLVLAGRF